MKPPSPEIERILYTEEQVARRIAEVGDEISAKYHGRELKLIGVLKGSVFFLTALAKQIDIPVKIDFLSISSFSTEPSAPGLVRIAKDLDDTIEGQDVVLVEDIVDTGLTITYLLGELRRRNPRTVNVCTLLDKSVRRIVPVRLRFVGFPIEDEFVLGYGMDYAERYRNLKRVVAGDLNSLRRDPDVYVEHLFGR